MVTVLSADNKEQVREWLAQILNREGNLKFALIRQGNFVKIINEDDFNGLISIEEKIADLQAALYDGNKGGLYKAVVEQVERPLIEDILQRTEGNQLKAAKILGLNRNTIGAKIKKLGINVRKLKSENETYFISRKTRSL